MTEHVRKSLARFPPWASFLPSKSSALREIPILLAAVTLFYALLTFARYGVGPFHGQVEISLSPAALPKYTLFSLMRLAAAYVLSLLFTLVYGYIAAYNAKAERFMLPLLDTLQSIPVLSFLPGVMLSMIALFPGRQLGLELGSILLIFTGQAWNMTFSFYSSLKNLPRELREATSVYGFSGWQRFVQFELPYAFIGLTWNSMMSIAGGWFFLMACEMFVLGDRDLRLPGLGSYLQTAASAGDIAAIAWGLAVMITVIALIDQLIWRPVIAWGEKFKFEQVEAAHAPYSPVLEWVRKSRVLATVDRRLFSPLLEAATLHFARRHTPSQHSKQHQSLSRIASTILGYSVLLLLAFGAFKVISAASGVSRHELQEVLVGAGATFLRVEVVLLLALAWTVPVGVFIGLRPRVSFVLQPLAQIAASVPATALFPVILLMLIRLGGGLGIGSIALLLLGTQWYILFNVIAGASAIPSDLKEVCAIFRFGTIERWRKLILPAIFPYLITGLVTASGGAWNASIVAEYFHFKGQVLSTVGLGAVISSATDSGNFRLLLFATMIMAALVVTINRLLWRRLYALAATRYSLDT